MANYNTFVIIDCKKRKNLLVTSSARKAKKEMHSGVKIEVWNENTYIETIYSRQVKAVNKYIALEKQHVADKQKRAFERNQRRRKHGL